MGAIDNISKPDQREAHAGRERIRHRTAIRVEADQRLQQGRGELIRQRDEPDLSEIQVERDLQQRIDRRHQRLHHVVQEVAKADGRQNRECGLSRLDPSAFRPPQREHLLLTEFPCALCLLTEYRFSIRYMFSGGRAMDPRQEPGYIYIPPFTLIT